MPEIAFFHPWDHKFLINQTPSDSGAFTGYNFTFDRANESADFCVVWGGLPENMRSVKCSARHFIYITDEAHYDRTFRQGFIDQFDAVITCRTDIRHARTIRTHELNIWHLPFSRDTLEKDQKLDKCKALSLVASDLTILTGHKKRYAFVNKLIGHFKDRLDVYGRGFNPVANKWDALSDYKYSIAIENSALPGYFTEKLSECYLAECLPVYYGATDIDRYFAEEAMVNINIDDFKASITTIEKLLEEDPYSHLRSGIIEQKKTYLERYHLFPGLIRILQEHFTPSSGFRRKRILAEDRFDKYFLLKKVDKTFRRLLR
ncbi:MAG: hypothetical protein INR69_15505 [Mucilaginibacter polytrichastri]|nr:hypothetical protein [Mucilaginibacter polytrichastri]